MAKVMLREVNGVVSFYFAKKDMEETIEEIEFDTEEKWGGNATLPDVINSIKQPFSNISRFYNIIVCAVL